MNWKPVDISATRFLKSSIGGLLMYCLINEECFYLSCKKENRHIGVEIFKLLILYVSQDDFVWCKQ